METTNSKLILGVFLGRISHLFKQAKLQTGKKMMDDLRLQLRNAAFNFKAE